MSENDPFEGPNIDDAEPHTPRVNLSYASETLQSGQQTRLSLGDRIRALFSFGGRHFLTTIKASVVALILFTYPAMSVFGHQVDDTPIELDESRHWAVPEIGVTSVLLAREIDGPGWLADKHSWHPQSRLTALPAWQAGLKETLSDHGRLLLNVLSEERDQDLIAAIRLLDPDEKHRTTDRLMAATEALVRYDDRVAGGVTRAPVGAPALIARLNASANRAAREYAKLADVSENGDGWLASEEAITSVYYAKAVAHVTFSMLKAATEQDKTLMTNLGADEQTQDMLRKWRAAAQIRPLFVANQGTASVSGTSHPAILALHMNQARLASQDLAQYLEIALQEQAEATTPAEPIAVASGPSESN